MSQNIQFKNISKNVLIILMILVFWTANPAACDVQISDSVSPLKIEIDLNEVNGLTDDIEKSVFLRNSGNEPIDYIFYIENKNDTNKKEPLMSVFKLSVTETAILPENTFELKITIFGKELGKYDSVALEDVKLKIIRNPNTQTPVGYIIPIKIIWPEEKEVNKSDKRSNLIVNNSKGNETEFPKNEKENESVNEYDEEQKKTNSETKRMLLTEKNGILFSFIILLLVILSACTLYFQKGK